MTHLLLPSHFLSRPYAARQLAKVVAWAAANHPFYQKKYQYLSGTIPLLSRSEILANNALLLADNPETGRTSGSTGIPVRFSWSRQRQLISQQENARYTKDWLGGALPRTRIIRAKGALDEETVDIATPIDQQIQALQRRYRNAGAVSVITYPTNAAELAQQVIDQHIDMGFIQRFSCYAEAFEPWQEQLVATAFPNAKIYTTYSATELGMIAARCPHEPAYHHIFARKLAVEVLDDNDQLCPPGELGRVVVTDFFNYNSPFIRYDIGDMAASASCPCGIIKLPALTQIAGKVRGLLRDANGKRVMFSHLDAALRDVPGMGQFQVIQHALQEFELRFVAAASYQQPSFESAARSLFAAQFGHDVMVNFTPEQQIERGANGKFYASICNID